MPKRQLLEIQIFSQVRDDVTLTGIKASKFYKNSFCIYTLAGSLPKRQLLQIEIFSQVREDVTLTGIKAS